MAIYINYHLMSCHRVWKQVNTVIMLKMDAFALCCRYSHDVVEIAKNSINNAWIHEIDSELLTRN